MWQKIIKIRPLILFLIMLPFIASCNDEDDINAIFVGQTWYLGNFYTTSNWKDDNKSKPVYYTNTDEGKDVLSLINNNGTGVFYIAFQEKTFTAKGAGNTFSGTWLADGKKNTLVMNITSGSAPSGGDLSSRISRDFYNSIKNTRFYLGNIYYLKFFPEDKKSYIQVSKNRIEKTN